MSQGTYIIEYAIRYCITRKSYAFDDGISLAVEHWSELSEATKRDVIEAVNTTCRSAVDLRHRASIAWLVKQDGADS